LGLFALFSVEGSGVGGVFAVAIAGLVLNKLALNELVLNELVLNNVVTAVAISSGKRRMAEENWREGESIAKDACL
jgi:hypothetical protein